MKKNILWFLPFFIFIQNLPAQTNVSGIITSDTTWSITGTPYIVTGGILVDGGVTLMIEPGVTIKCNNGMSFQIDGAMIAQGTETDKITFTSNYAGEYWGYILFTDSSIDATYDIDGNYTGGSILEHCIVEYAGLLNIENNGSIRLNNAHPFINNCTIRNNTASGIYAWSLSDTLKITNNIISNNVETYYSIGGGIVISGRTATISNNIIRDNVAINGGGINIQHGSTAFITNNNINNNTATGSYWLDGGGGIYITSGNYSPSYVTISNNILNNNNAVSVGGGINAYYWRTTVYITNNVINNNNAGYSGGGIQAYQGGPSVISSNSIIANSSGLGSAIHLENADFQITNNTITENQATSETPAYAIFTNYPNSIISYNNIFGNITDSPPIYDLYYGSVHGSTNLNATNNWWGTTSGSIIQSLIYDWVDDGSLGIVDYIPYLDTPDTTAPPIPAQNLTITAIDNDLITLGWDSCLIGDLSGYKIYYDTDSTGYPYSYSIDVGNVTSYTLSNLYIGYTYYIAVKTYDIYGNESWYSNEMTGITRVMEVESLDIGGDEDSQHLMNHRPAISWHYYDSMNEPQTHFQAQVSSQPTFLVISHWNTGEVLSSDSSTIYWGDSLVNGETQYLRVKVGSNGFWSDWASLQFRMNSTASVPVTIYPTFGIVVDEPINLMVENSSDPEGDTLQYRFFVYDDIDLTILLDSSDLVSEGDENTLWQVTATLPDNGQYFWIVEAYDGYEFSERSEPQSFLVNTENNVPVPFSLVSPESDSEVSTLTPTFTWNVSFDPDPMDGVFYTLYLDTPEPGVEMFNAEMDTTFQLINPLLDNTEYHWKVVAKDLMGFETNNEGGYQRFTTNLVHEPPSVVDLISPDSVIVLTLTPEFHWTESIDPDPNDSLFYDVYWWEEGIDTSSWLRTNTNYCIIPTPLNDNSKYCWFVNACDYSWHLSRSDSAVFWTDVYPEAPLAFTTIYPEDNAEGLSLQIEFVWNQTTDPDPLSYLYYGLTYATDWADSSTYFNISPINDTNTVVSLENNTEYYWLVEAIDDDQMATASNSGYPFRLVVGTLSTEANGTIPTEFLLHQNYPNPFNPITTIQYELPQRSDVQITIYDLLGRKVMALVSEIQEAGYRTIEWDATNVASGMYFYQIRAGEFVQTRKMILLK